ncbi:MAG: ComEC/Rec2 family competence protein [Planctomycetales bacterium]
MSAAPRLSIAVAPPPRVQTPQSPPTHPRAPALPVAIALGVGVVLDDAWSLPLPLWLAVGGLAWIGWTIQWRRRRRMAAAVWLLLAVIATGGGWRHFRWSLAEPDHLGRYAEERPQPVRILGRLATQPAIVPRLPQDLPSAIPQFDRTQCLLECRSLVSGDQELSAAGLIRLEVSGHMTHANFGDKVDLVGQMSRPRPPQNPGEFDFRQHLRTTGVLVVVRCEEPEDVRVTSPSGIGWCVWQGRIRTRAERLIAEHLSERTAPIGTALLLGGRGGISEELRLAFAESGTMHILAISGANVGILAGLVWLVARLLGCGQSATAALVLGGILAYASLADAQPPVWRAVLMFVAIFLGRPWFRTAPQVNGLALAAIGVIIWNPAHLFDTGAQLSFLAVGALTWVWTCWPLHRVDQNTFDPERNRPQSWSVRLGRKASFGLLASLATLVAVWIFTLPLTMNRFHLVSPIGLLVNLILAPVVVVILWSGYALMLLGLLIPPTAPTLGFLFDGGIRLMLWLVEESASLKWGHWYLSGPGTGWLAGYYLCLMALVGGLPGTHLRRWGWRALGIWLLCGLGFGLLPRHPSELRCTFLSVGHGLSVLVELPNGKTLLYDAGQLQNGQRASHTVQAALWERGIPRIDAVLVSHADLDHFNGVPGLARTTRLGEVLAHPTFLQSDQEEVRMAREQLAERRIPLRAIWAGDRLMLDGRVSITIRHPERDERYPLDNANSLVCEIEYAGRKILLTGDLEREGLQSLLRQPRWRGDVLLAPHHGSLSANSRILAEWGAAEWVIVSGGFRDPSAALREVYSPWGQVLSTADCGAITIEVSPAGNLECTTFVQEFGETSRAAAGSSR